jgi:copper transport protein
MIRRLLLAVAAVGALVLLTGAPAAAHASLLETDPADGAVLAAAPRQVVFTFNEPIRLPDGAVHAFEPDGSDWPVSARVTDNRLIVTPDRDPGTGTVVVAWKVISADGHIVGGALTFSIGSATAGGPAVAHSHASVTTLRWVAAAIAGLGLLGAVALGLVGARRRDLAWNAGFTAAVLLAPLHQLAADGRGLTGLGDWLVWLDGVTRPSSLLLLGGFVVVAVARPVPRRVVAAAVTVPALVLLGGAAYSWPRAAGPPAAAHSGTATTTADLAGAGTVRLTVQREAGRAVSLRVELLDPDGRPLAPYAPPTLTVVQQGLSLGDATLTQAGPGSYRAEVTIPTDGDWTARVSVRLDEFTNPVAEVPFKV